MSVGGTWSISPDVSSFLYSSGRVALEGAIVMRGPVYGCVASWTQAVSVVYDTTALPTTTATATTAAYQIGAPAKSEIPPG